jgi:hypothetical protein
MKFEDPIEHVRERFEELKGSTKARESKNMFPYEIIHFGEPGEGNTF